MVGRWQMRRWRLPWLLMDIHQSYPNSVRLTFTCWSLTAFFSSPTPPLHQVQPLYFLSSSLWSQRYLWPGLWPFCWTFPWHSLLSWSMVSNYYCEQFVPFPWISQSHLHAWTGGSWWVLSPYWTFPFYGQQYHRVSLLHGSLLKLGTFPLNPVAL